MSGTCGACLHFEADPHALDRALPGTRTLSSVHGASRAGDGTCRLHGRLLPASASCKSFTPCNVRLAVSIRSR